ncbi:SIR2-like domain protein [Wenxinia marina DSM 24838]|uniref:SIR2-like domain protein n=2 Tax=Wenxinia TaxID=653686 RepID=A0A0D0Q6J2_9RHOB|nr:SIR2-like domain protein [Wenxinia marina DSM 24838]
MPETKVHLPPGLPTSIDGIVKLHGSIDALGMAADGVVLSTASFGAAYLADGWAARFMRELLERHTVVFLGYSADDPPMQYLLEGLRRAGAPTGRAYAFHPGDDGGRWAAKGVTALPYDVSSGHALLWDTLEAWADRVADPAAWRTGVAKRARKGPRQLTPHERGQVADLLSSREGALAFVEASPPADWVCVLDPLVRFGSPGYEAPDPYSSEAAKVDPQRLYGLDDDPDSELDHTQDWPQREVPSNAWNAFAWIETDHSEVLQELTVPSQSRLGRQEALMPPRILAIEAWLAKVSGEPASLWWWARQGAPRGRFRWMMRSELRRGVGPCDAPLAWEMLYEHWDADRTPTRFDEPSHAVYEFKESIAGTGWTSAAVSRFEDMARPRLRVRPDFSVAPPPKEAGVLRRKMFSTQIDYRDDFWRIDCPDEWVQSVAEALGRNLARLGTLVSERRGLFALSNLPPFVRPDDDSSTYEYVHDLGAAVFGYCAMLDRLRTIDRAAFDRHISAWPEGPFLARLRLWLALNIERSDGAAAAAIMTDLPDDLFWYSRMQRDLLHAIRDRWDDLPEAARERLTERLRDGPSDETLHWVVPDERPEVRAWLRLQAVGWLTREGVNLPLDWRACQVAWRRDAPRWSEDSIVRAIDPLVSRGGAVATDTEYAMLVGIPVEQVVSVALEHSGRTDDFLVETDPFSGLARADLERSCDAIRRSTADAEDRGKALHKLLVAAVEVKHPVDPILDLLRVCPNEILCHEPWAIGHWAMSMSKDAANVLAMNPLLDRFVRLLADIPCSSDPDPDWAFLAINSPAGQVAVAMMHDPRLPDAAGGAIPVDWQARVEEMLRLPHPHGEYVRTILGGHARYLHAHAPGWVETSLLLGLDGARGDALLAGFLWDSQEFSSALFGKVRSILLAAALKAQEGRAANWIAGQLILAWRRSDGSLEDETFRDTLRRGGEAIRLATIREAGRLLSDDLDLDRLFRTIWPRQAALQTDMAVLALVDLALTGRSQEAIELHLRRLARWPQMHLLRNLDDAASMRPRETLAILDRIIPDVPTDPIHGAAALLAKIVAADPALDTDVRLLRLKQMVE